MKISESAINAYILAGGKSTRMGQDKGMVLLGKKPFVMHVHDILNEIFPDISIIANRKEYLSLGLRVLPDLIAEKGPIGGIYTGLKESQRMLNFFISCDMPFITAEAIWQLLQHAELNQITVAKVGAQIHPLFGVYPTAFMPKIEQSITSDRLKLLTLLEELNTVYVDFPQDQWEATFSNVNTFEGLKSLGPN